MEDIVNDVDDDADELCGCCERNDKFNDCPSFTVSIFESVEDEMKAV